MFKVISLYASTQETKIQHATTITVHQSIDNLTKHDHRFYGSVTKESFYRNKDGNGIYNCVILKSQTVDRNKGFFCNFIRSQWYLFGTWTLVGSLLQKLGDFGYKNSNYSVIGENSLSRQLKIIPLFISRSEYGFGSN